MRLAKILGAVAASLLFASTVTAAPATAGPTLRTTIDPSSVKESIDYLVQTYRVTEREALRRLELQNDAAKLEATLRKEAAGEYGGMWLDQQTGELVVAMTKPAAAQRQIAAMPDRANVEVRTVKHSLASLKSAHDRISRQVGAGAESVYLPAISTTENRVVVWERAWLRENKVGAAAQAEIRTFDADPGMVSARVLREPTPYSADPVDWGFCHPLYCTNYGPMRGGLRLDMRRDNGTTGGCTSGFNLRTTGGAFPGVPWVLTAGHCMSTKTNDVPTQHNRQVVLNQHGIEKNFYPYDYAAVRYVDAATATTWLEGQTNRNTVLKYCRNGGLDSNGDTPCGPQVTSQNQEITSVTPLSGILTGAIVCASGSGSSAVNYPDSFDSGAGEGYLVGTRCGRVLSTDVGINTDVCARNGDSGGPLFSQVTKAGLGILNGSQQARSGACQLGELNNYAPLSTILEDLSARQASGGSVFNVITTPQG
ncbi:streptogrisin C [Lentzea albidocapillata subsp. violacea]|uniref:Streptogrisin C n=1 Tax=Lentzea albidocapillata subsp. violacea TaxID=128104 RepID=A0A1G9PDU7_9PSEU|nr:trypsin-like serine protease [Lentzea albidocapillata]SDL96723.1 streptogrisin C [Lentzea albidocapillata subsp. violacea]